MARTRRGRFLRLTDSNRRQALRHLDGEVDAKVSGTRIPENPEAAGRFQPDRPDAEEDPDPPPPSSPDDPTPES